MDGPVGVVGASARAAVMSLARAGFSAWAADLFADRDLQRIAACVRCPFDAFPQAMPELTERFPPGSFLYTGGLENHPDVVGALSHRRPLWGNGPEVLRQVRDPFRLARQLANPLRQQPEHSPVPDSGRWLLKSLRSSGGLGVRFARPGETIPAGSYLQEFISGPAPSAVFFGPRILGITEQLIGTSWLHTDQFHYAGTIGPIEVSAETRSQIASIGVRLVSAFGLEGIFGIDFIMNEGRAWVVEVNLRYPASAEVLEHAGGFAVFHPASRVYPRTDAAIIGKAIYFAPHAFRFPLSGPWDADLAGAFDPWRLPAFADIPEPGEVFETGSPVLTHFASGSDVEECRVRLQSRASELDELFAKGTP